MRKIAKAAVLLLITIFLTSSFLFGQHMGVELTNHNNPDREEWLKDLGFGMFIHWNIDVQLGTVISHTLVGSSSDYADKYISELPSTFNPVDWNPEKIVILAKMPG